MGIRPRRLDKIVFALAEEDDLALAHTGQFRDRLIAAAPDDPLLVLWEKYLSEWDFQESPDWSGAGARTGERRADAYGRLGLDADVCKSLTAAVPVPTEPGATVISTEHEAWFNRDTAAARSFYWEHYAEHLRAKGWKGEAIAALDESSQQVVERLSDPTRTTAYSARGLVVGYVQSGKTANFTGVAAKAIDSGYRLVIVLGGTLNLLRRQTQRRLDMELVGQENILRGADPQDPGALVGIDYQEDADWPGLFVSHRGRPSQRGLPDIERLTTRDKDYRSLAQGIRALEFEKHDRRRPLHDPENLYRAAARLMVVKKNKSVLTSLVKDLKQIGPILNEIPALIIDDESDQASVNTTDPKKWESGKPERKAINGLISQLLSLLPRAQYIGYTATPFANVFIDPSDAEDIFPRDFLISLPRPQGYMGAQDFHDFDPVAPVAQQSYADSHQRAHVRGIYADDDRLQEAMDTFLLTGAMKLYRADRNVPDEPFRHHTMLVHESVKTDDHGALALRINSMWHQAEYTGPGGHARLAKLFDQDIRPVSEARAGHLPVPADYAELKPYVSAARQLVARGGNPVVVVNGDSDRYFEQIDLDFEGQPHIWKILVGGTKLSRGFTVEGLTVTYYRRTASQADTLMQMGRWFGFRNGYRDLVRLFIGRAEQIGKKTVDLYEAFEAVCRDEEDFRSQLRRYAEPVDGRAQVTPAQIPPLVSQHLSWVKPSSRTKMFNAELVEVRSPGEWVEPSAYPKAASELRRNCELWLPVLNRLEPAADPFLHVSESSGRQTRFTARTAVLPHSELLVLFEQLVWGRPDLMAPHLEYLRDPGPSGCGTDDWLVIAPQTTGPGSVQASILGSPPLTLVQRSRGPRGTFNRISGMAHRQSPERIAGRRAADAADSAAARFARPRRGVVLLYPVIELDPGAAASLSNGHADPHKTVMACGFMAATDPAAPRRPLIRFRTIDSSQSSAVVVPVQGTDRQPR
ncbi:Z1 domain-containing protein [Kitasatospora sp. NPDC048239]|uniref:Z1 domain-containing protein n=1 Tax=Kitasatospora sp. NPDC048239 TaxID=3364046 RepID=UPI00371E6B94